MNASQKIRSKNHKFCSDDFPATLQKSKKRLTRQTTEYFSQPSSVKMFFKKMEMCFSGKKASSVSQTLKFTSVLFWFGKSLYTRKKGHFEKKGTKKQSNVKVLIRNQVFWKLIRQRSPYHLHPTASLRYKPEEQFQEGKRFSQFLDVLQC